MLIDIYSASNLIAQADHSVFHPEYEILGPLDAPLGHLDHTHYEGRLIGEDGSHVYGSLRDGVFDGTIHTRRYASATDEHRLKVSVPGTGPSMWSGRVVIPTSLLQILHIIL